MPIRHAAFRCAARQRRHVGGGERHEGHNNSTVETEREWYVYATHAADTLR